jgi:hypothetical protein
MAVMSTTPDPAGAVAVSDVGELTLTLVALVAPNLTAVFGLKSVPVTVTEAPPAWEPSLGSTVVMLGTGS